MWRSSATFVNALIGPDLKEPESRMRAILVYRLVLIIPFLKALEQVWHSPTNQIGSTTEPAKAPPTGALSRNRRYEVKASLRRTRLHLCILLTLTGPPELAREIYQRHICYCS